MKATITSKATSTLTALVIMAVLLVPASASASLAAECGTLQTTTNTAQTTAGQRSDGLSNPVKGSPSLACLFYKIVDFVISLSYVVIAIFLLLSGFKFVTAQGSDEKLTEAKRTFFFTVIGALILIGAYTIIQVVQGIIQKLQS